MDDNTAIPPATHTAKSIQKSVAGAAGSATQNQRQFMIKRKILFALMIAATVTNSFAAGNGMAGINEATSMVSSYFDPGTKLVYAIGAVVGLIGGIKVYSKFSSGDPDTSKTAASWFGACIFLIVAATILRSFFL